MGYIRPFLVCHILGGHRSSFFFRIIYNISITLVVNFFQGYISLVLMCYINSGV